MLPGRRLGGENVWVKAARMGKFAKWQWRQRGSGNSVWKSRKDVMACHGTPGHRTITITFVTVVIIIITTTFCLTITLSRKIQVAIEALEFFSVWSIVFEEPIVSIMLSMPKMASTNESLNSPASCRPDFYKLFAIRSLTCVNGFGDLTILYDFSYTLVTPILVSPRGNKWGAAEPECRQC